MMRSKVSLRPVPEILLEGSPVLLRGSGWPDCPIEILVRKRPATIDYVLQGDRVDGGVRPRGGEFVVRLTTLGLKPGRYEVTAENAEHAEKTAVRIRRRPRPRRKEEDEGEDEDVNLTYWRDLALFERRFAHIGYIPAEVAATRARSLDRLRQQRMGSRAGLEGFGARPGVLYSAPVPGGTNWTPLGPAPVIAGLPAVSSLPAVAGRVCSIAIDPGMPDRIYIGAVNGGVWKSVNGGVAWSPKTDDMPAMAIGALAIDPNATNRIFAGTGEYHHDFPYGAYGGQGLLYSSDHGDTWTQLAAGTFDRAEISRILFDPHDTAHHMFLSCETGVFESASGGTGWTLMRAGSASDLVLVDLGGSPPSLQLIAAFYGDGLYANTLAGGVWAGWSLISSGAFPGTFGRIALGQSRNHPLTIWSAFSDPVSSGEPLAGIARSIDGGGSWTAVAGPTPSMADPTPVYGTNSMLYLAVHPDTPDTVFLGTNRLWRTTTGAAPFTEVASVSIIHMDHHAFAFDPVNPDIVYACGDGGVYRSPAGATNWEHRNVGVGTLQFYDLSNHPQWAAVLFGGTQDNDAALGTGAPAWQSAAFGDVVVAVIDPAVPTRMYSGVYGQIYRSDDSSQSWHLKYSFSGPYEWNFAFITDPSLAGVCYTGGNTLDRSGTAGDSWTTITPVLTGNITTIAVHPANSDIVYVGTSQGKVYRVQRTGADWTLPNVSTTDITGPPLPAGLYISCIAVDTVGTVWVSFSSILQSAATGEFSNDHVYRLPAGSMTWENRSAGLAQANPINALVIDPANDDLLFCGGDSGVFRWDAMADTWALWDQGLPNAPVFRLTIHNPSRLIRAATYGRSCWERPIDVLVEPMVDIYLRDDILDAARDPAPSGVPHPFHPATLVWWWQSEDIKVDAPPFQTPAAVTDEAALANEVEHRNAQRGATNRFYVQVHNRGPNKATSVRVRAFFADASLALPNLPADFWSATKPFDADPSAVNWTPIGATMPAGDIEPGQSAVVSWDWLVPMSAAAHSCLLAIATCTEDALALPGDFDIVDVIVNHNNATLKNLTIV